MKSIYKALNMALSMFTIIPLPKYEWDESSAKHIMKFYPFIGLIVGLIWYGVVLVLSKLNIYIGLLSAIALAAPYILTGFLHLDGFMDVSDALLSRRNKEEKIRILKDSRVGAFSVIALVLTILIEFTAMEGVLINNINLKVFILIPIASRCICGLSILSGNMIGESYLGKLFKKDTTIIDKIILISIYIITLIISFVLVGFSGLISLILMGVLGLILFLNCNRELGGINGDVGGYMLVLTEFIAIITLCIV